MRRWNGTVMLLLGLGVFAAAPALALGPVDGEVGAVWWANDLRATSSGASATADAAAPGIQAQLWMFKRYGVQAARFGSDPEGYSGSTNNYTNLDVMWRPYSPTENNYVAVGLGWQMMQLESVGMDGDTSGLRLAVGGRVSLLDVLAAYGQAAYLPSLDGTSSIDPAAGRFENLDGYEYELGVAWKVAPFVSMRAGYRVASLDFEQEPLAPAGVDDAPFGTTGNFGGPTMPSLGSDMGCCTEGTVGGRGNAESSGFFAGVGIRF